MKKEATIYIDSRGWKYQVMPGIGGNTYKARYQKAGSQRWACYPHLPWRDTPEEAEADLNALAQKKGWVCCFRVSGEALKHIIQDRKPLGRYFAADVNRWAAVDNRTGDARTEGFLDLDSALQWLCRRSANE